MSRRRVDACHDTARPARLQYFPRHDTGTAGNIQHPLAREDTTGFDETPGPLPHPGQHDISFISLWPRISDLPFGLSRIVRHLPDTFIAHVIHALQITRQSSASMGKPDSGLTSFRTNEVSISLIRGSRRMTVMQSPRTPASGGSAFRPIRPRPQRRSSSGFGDHWCESS